MPFNLLIIEDDDDIRTMLSDSLDHGEYQIYEAADGKAGLEMFRNHGGIDLVILDLMLPKIDGLTVLRRIRESSTLPVLILSAKDGEYDKVLGLEYGADDYLTKPFSIIELQARVKSLLRRVTEYQTPDQSDVGKCVSVGDLTIEPDNYIVRKNGQTIALTAKEFQLIKLFAMHPDKVYTKVQLYKAVWDEQFLNDENVVNVTIRRLREKIEENPSEPRYIKTIWGIGYKLGGDSQRC